jgi:hypothetical protein
MSNAPLFEDPRAWRKFIKDPEVRQILARAQEDRLILSLILLVVLVVIFLPQIFR